MDVRLGIDAERYARAVALTAALVCLLAIPTQADAAHNVYATNDVGLIDAYAVNASTGALTPISPSAFATGPNPKRAAIDPAGRHLFVPSSAGVWVYGIDQSSGGLTLVSGSPFAAGTSSWSAAVNPSGTRLYVANNGSGDTSVYNIDPSTGALTAISGSPFVTGPGPHGIAIDPAGKHLYVANLGSNRVSVFNIDQSTGALAGASSTDAGTVYAVSIDPAGKHLYTATASGDVYAFDIDSSSGALTPVSGSPFTAEADSVDAVVDPSGQHLFVSDKLGGPTAAVSAFEINSSTGVLNEVVGSPFTAAAGFGQGAAITPDGLRLYAADGGGLSVVNGFSVGSTGVLTGISGSPFAASSNSAYVAITPNQPPTAAFSAQADKGGAATTFNASASSDDGTITSYDWDFGDGTVLSNGGPTPWHTYANAGTYTVNLTVDDGEGCSGFLWAGYTAYCNGPSIASTTSSVTFSSSTPPVPPVALVLSNFKLSPSRLTVRRSGPVMRTLAARRAKKKKGGTVASFTLSEAATIRLAFEKKVNGRRKGKRCLAGKKAAKRGKRCTVYHKAGTISMACKAGRNKTWLAGRIGKRGLRPGRYRVIASARSGSRSSKPATAQMTVTRSRR